MIGKRDGPAGYLARLLARHLEIQNPDPLVPPILKAVPLPSPPALGPMKPAPAKPTSISVRITVP
jgi:hypothetical protein